MTLWINGTKCVIVNGWERKASRQEIYEDVIAPCPSCPQQKFTISVALDVFVSRPSPLTCASLDFFWRRESKRKGNVSFLSTAEKELRSWRGASLTTWPSEMTLKHKGDGGIAVAYQTHSPWCHRGSLSQTCAVCKWVPGSELSRRVEVLPSRGAEQSGRVWRRTLGDCFVEGDSLFPSTCLLNCARLCSAAPTCPSHPFIRLSLSSLLYPPPPSHCSLVMISWVSFWFLGLYSANENLYVGI